MRRLHLVFETEQELRSRGRSRTPDALLLVPMGVVTELRSDAAPVCWVDSKALFADLETFRDNLPQFRAYTHRFGPGLVIYWLGFVSSVLAAAEAEGLGLLITHSFPRRWIFPTGEEATELRPPSFLST
jgi:hypothetical protein